MMKKAPLFKGFVAAFWKEAKESWPTIQKVSKGSVIDSCPAASTFYLGCSPVYGMHIHIHFQKTSKSWEGDRFTINVYISESKCVLGDCDFSSFDPNAFNEGVYRLGLMAGN